MAEPATQSRPREVGTATPTAGPAEGCLRRPPVVPFHAYTNMCTLDSMHLAGIPIRDEDVRELVGLLRDGGMEDVAHELDHALLIETMVLALTVVDRESILRALDDPPTDGLAELRATLLVEHEWRVREGLV